ncbi:MAG: thiamine-monophosphate kinase [Candidatus Aminicenantales bacterium]
MIDQWARFFKRSPLQVNRTHEADAELLRIDDTTLLAVTIDSVVEEISAGVYEDPFTMGWVVVMSNFSDLAAVGAQPLGIVISVCFDPAQEESFRKRMAEGAAEACHRLGVCVLGGDMNAAEKTSLTGCALGFVPKNQKMIRLGCQPGDILFISGKAGSGNALGMRKLSGLPEDCLPENSYRPVARIKECQTIRKYATSCMDTSDGLFITLDQLFRLNRKGFIFQAEWSEFLDPAVLKFCQQMKIPAWFMAGGIHGEFELVFTIPAQEVRSFLQDAESIGFFPIRLGRVQEELALTLSLASMERINIDMAPLRNLWTSSDRSLKKILQEYHAWGKRWGLE